MISDKKNRLSRGGVGLRLAWPYRSFRCALLVALLVLPGALQAQGMSWQVAVATLAGERTRAETCVQLLKRHAGDDAAALSRGQLLYDDAKAGTDEVIAGLIVVLAQGDQPPSLPDLEAKLTQSVKVRETFCSEVTALVPKDDGTKSLVGDLVGAFLEPLIEAAVELYKFESEEDRLLRKTIQTQLEATKWSKFESIEA